MCDFVALRNSSEVRKPEELEIYTGVAMAMATILGVTINKILDLCRAHPQVYYLTQFRVL